MSLAEKILRKLDSQPTIVDWVALVALFVVVCWVSSWFGYHYG